MNAAAALHSSVEDDGDAVMRMTTMMKLRVFPRGPRVRRLQQGPLALNLNPRPATPINPKPQ